MCNKAVNICLFVSVSVPNQFKTQEMSDEVVSEEASNFDLINTTPTKCVK